MSEDRNENVLRFVSSARRFCYWAENFSYIDERSVVETSRLLAELQLAVLSLPQVNPDVNDEDDRLGREDWATIRDRFSDLPFQGYWGIFYVFNDDETPVYSTVSDDIADIYRDVKQDLLLYDSGNTEGALWSWRFSYYSHWGRHLTSVQTAFLEHLRYQVG